MKHIKDIDSVNEDNYKDPSTFEDVKGIDVSLTDLRKKMKISVGESSVELSKDEAEKILGAIDTAIKRM